ncbi:alanine dehydrogenase [Lysobacter korlensis]|uniref:Alanine dehydrogenase n=1 Tax=Lysobacter korlensis TaxID=553636 RepID=A0ABV6RZV3_9GAMM
MRIGVPREVKNNEFRVAITPAGAHDLVEHGHQVLVETGAGGGSSIPDEAYAEAGATLVPDADAVWGDADVVMKVKEPIESEYRHFRPGLVLFAYLHLAAEADLTRALARSGVTAIAYETVQLPSRVLPLLAPMSEVAGRLAPLVGANAMLKPNGGPGLLMPGVPGTRPAKVVVLGGGVAGANATSVSVGLGADVTVLDTNLQRLVELDALYAGRIKTLASSAYAIERAVLDADLVIGSVLVPGARAPKLVSNALVSRMLPGSVLVDIAVDQGGCFEDSHPTTHADPTFRVHGSLFYCVANMPGAVPATSTYALTNATLPYVRALAAHGWRDALAADPAFALGLNVHDGSVVNDAVAAAHGLDHARLDAVLTG